MTEGERDIMTHHVAYWTDEADKRISIVFGPVFDPKGAYGLGIIEVENESGSNSRCKGSSGRIQASKIGNLSGARNFAQIEVSDQPPWLWLVLMDSSFTPCFHGYSSEVVIRELM